MNLEKEKKLLIEMVMRQTTYTYEECEEKLNLKDNNYMEVIKEFYGIKEQPKKEITINQGIIKEIRCLMDNASNNFRIKQEMQKRKEELYEKQRKIAESKKLNNIIEENENEK